jgi:hypothetical protein
MVEVMYSPSDLVAEKTSCDRNKEIPNVEAAILKSSPVDLCWKGGVTESVLAANNWQARLVIPSMGARSLRGCGVRATSMGIRGLTDGTGSRSDSDMIGKRKR